MYIPRSLNTQREIKHKSMNIPRSLSSQGEIYQAYMNEYPSFFKLQARDVT